MTPLNRELLSQIRLTGVGHSLGSKVVLNQDVAAALGLETDWFEKRTGISERRVCADGEHILTLGAKAIQNACSDAGIELGSLGHETVLIHIQNGFTHLTPPPGFLLSNYLGCHRVRILGLDGVCSEPINGLELAALMLTSGSCSKVILSAAVDFMPVVSATDLETAGLFGAGAGAVVIERASLDSRDRGLKSIYWETHANHCGLGDIPLLSYRRGPDVIEATFGYYTMKGTELAKVALKIIPRVVRNVLDQAGWTTQDLDLVITHQPNAKLLEIGIKLMNFDPSIVSMPVKTLGNMGPASLLVAFSMAKQNGQAEPGTRLLLLSFGLGFSCGAATLIL